MPDEILPPSQERLRWFGIPKQRSGPAPARRVAGSRGMVASAANLKVGTAAATAVLKRRSEWQALCWDAYDCLDEQTEILTVDGWRSHDQIGPGTLVLTFQPDDGTSRWEPVQEVRRHQLVEETVARIDSQQHSSLSTMHHRWPVMYQGWSDGERVWRPEWTVSHLLDRHQHKIRTAATCIDVPDVAKHDDALVELVAWFWTEGTIVKADRPNPMVAIAQSHQVNPANCSRIVRALTALFGGPSDMGQGRTSDATPRWRQIDRERGMRSFKLNAAAASVLLEHTGPAKQVNLQFVRDLTAAQLELFIHVSLIADGNGADHITQAVPERLDALELAAILSGRTPHRWADATETKWHLRLRTTQAVSIRSGYEEQKFTGTVWCPVTPSQTWMARRDGTVYFTGNTVGEVKYGTNFLGNALSKVNLYVGLRPETMEDDARPVPESDDAAALAEAGMTAADAALVRHNFDRLAAGSDGHGELLRKLAINFTVPGECYLVGLEHAVDRPDDDRIGPDTPAEETWQILSIDEIGVDQSGRKLELYDAPGGKSTRSFTVDDEGNVTGDATVDGVFVTRIWQSHPRFHLLPDSPLRGVLSSIEELLLAEQATRAAFRTRMNAGVFLVPEGMSFGGLDETDGGDEDETDDPFDLALAEILTAPVDDEESGASLVPGVIRGKAEHLKEIRHLTFDRKIDDHIDTRTDRALKRLAQGMNVPVEIVTGMGDANHWTGWLIRDETFTAHVEPLALQICQALTTGWLLPILEAAGVDDPGRFVVWYDPSSAIVRPNQTANANDAITHGAINLTTYRKALGFSEEDAPDVQDPAVDTALRLIAGAPSLVAVPGLTVLVEQLRAVLGGDEPAPNPDGDATTAPSEGDPSMPDTDAVAAAAGAPGADRIRPGLGARLAEIDRALRLRVQSSADAALERAASRVGANLRSRASRDQAVADSINGIDNGQVAATLGPRLVEALGVNLDDTLRGQFATVGALFERLGRQAQATVLAAVPGLDDADREVLAAQQVRDLGAARTWLEAELERFAAERIFEQADKVFEGEHDGVSSVPFGIIREATSRAGGQASVTAAAVSPRDLAVGIATGALATTAMQQAGVEVEGWQWVYGPFPREHGFTPHERLDGVQFRNFDDPVLANTGSWPADTHFVPGDHPGCVCDVIPVLLDAASIPDADVVFEVAGATPPGGPNLGPASEVFFDRVDEALAQTVGLIRHGGGGYTTGDGRWYLHRVGESWQLDRQTRTDDERLTAALAAVVPSVAAARTFIALA